MKSKTAATIRHTFALSNIFGDLWKNTLRRLHAATYSTIFARNQRVATGLIAGGAVVSRHIIFELDNIENYI